MHDETIIVRERQRLIRREMDRRGIALRAVQLDGGWDDPSTVQSWFPGEPQDKRQAPKDPAVMSVAGLYRLISKGALPLDLLSLLLPAGHAIVCAPEALDHDEIAEAMEAYLATKNRAHHPLSEAGREIGPGEDNVLRGQFARVTGAVA